MKGVTYVNGSIKDNGTANTVAINEAYNNLYKIRYIIITFIYIKIVENKERNNIIIKPAILTNLPNVNPTAKANPNPFP